jgi:hypothetical protein
MRGFEPRGRRFDSCPRSLGDELVAADVCQQRKPMRGRSTVGRDALNVLMLVRFQPPQLGSTDETEVIRLDEEPVLKTGRGSAVVGSSPTASACNTRPWCNGSTTGSNPVSQGSSPWGRALGEPSPFVRAHGPTGRRQLRTLEIRVRLPVGPLRVMTVPWSSGEDTWPTSREPMVRVHPGPPWPRYANW